MCVTELQLCSKSKEHICGMQEIQCAHFECSNNSSSESALCSLYVSYTGCQAPGYSTALPCKPTLEYTCAINPMCMWWHTELPDPLQMSAFSSTVYLQCRRRRRQQRGLQCGRTEACDVTDKRTCELKPARRSLLTSQNMSLSAESIASMNSHWACCRGAQSAQQHA